MLQVHAAYSLWFLKHSTLFPHDYDKTYSIGKIIRNAAKENMHQSEKTHQTFIISTLIVPQLLCSQPPTMWHLLCSQQEIHKNQTCHMEPSAFQMFWDYVSCLKGLAFNLIFSFPLLQLSWLMSSTSGMYIKFKTLLVYTHEHMELSLFLSPQYFPTHQFV